MMISQVSGLPEAVRFVGIDVGKFTSVVAVHGQPGVKSFAMDAEGQAQLLGFLAGMPDAVRVGLEASGGWRRRGAMRPAFGRGWRRRGTMSANWPRPRSMPMRSLWVAGPRPTPAMRPRLPPIWRRTHRRGGGSPRRM